MTANGKIMEGKNMEELRNKQKELTQKLIEASKAYYNGKPVLMSDFEFDKAVEKLAEMEKRTGIIYSGSPTVSVGAQVVDELKSSKHEVPALSLDKCKYVEKESLIGWLNNKKGCLSWKLDGITIVATYDGGTLTKAVTRGNGEVGSDVTHNAMFFKGLPHAIPYKEHLVIRGEATMSHEEFSRINELAGGEYENERNLAAATIKMLDSAESKRREIIFSAFELVTPVPGKADFDPTGLATYESRIDFLEKIGINTVFYMEVDCQSLLSRIEEFKSLLPNYDLPTDGLVLSFDDQVYGESLGATGHHKRSGIALKWTDETKKTILRDVEWSVGKTGVVTPVAVFDPVRLGAGSTVTRASFHNISCLRNLPMTNEMEGLVSYGPDGERKGDHVALGDSIEVYLANMIIPKCASYGHNGDYNEAPRRSIEIPSLCPVCHQPLRQNHHNGVATLHCDNEDCSARRIGELIRTFGRDGLYVVGLGESQIEDLLQIGLLTKHPVTLFKFAEKCQDATKCSDEFIQRVKALIQMDGWGKKSVENLVLAVKKARKTSLDKFLYSLNVPMLGHDLSKKLSAHYDGKIQEFLWKFYLNNLESRNRLKLELTSLDGVGEEKAESVLSWWEKNKKNEAENEAFIELVAALDFEEPEKKTNSLEDLVFCITGSVHIYKSRKEFKESVERRGGKVTGSVTKNTNFLVINDLNSTTGKAKAAKELNCPMISEEQFVKKFGK